MDFNELIFVIMMLFLLLCWKQEEAVLLIFNKFSLGDVVKTTGQNGALPVIFFLHFFRIWFILGQTFSCLEPNLKA